VTPAKRVRLGGVVLLSVLLGGMLGYGSIEGASPVDALYMVVITLSTVGYGEVFPLSDAGRLLTIGIIVTGVGSALFTATAAVELGIDNLVGLAGRRRIAITVSKIEDHIILCGFGRVGRGTHEQLVAAGAPTVVIERDPESAEEARAVGALVVEGDATTNRVLDEAQIERARALVACVQNDSDNLVIVLSAKALCPELFVVARATEEESQEKLVLAGADRVVTPQRVGAHRLAAMALGSGLAEFLDLVVEGALVELQVQRLEIGPDCPLIGVSLREASIRERSGALILGLEDTRGRLSLNPDPEIVISEGQVLFGIGTDQQLEALHGLVGSKIGSEKR
jgi:voltage-gated potassium channel